MKLGDGLFLNTFRRVAEEYKSSGIEFNDMIVDNTYGYPPFSCSSLFI
jgi:isocitrate dehydrogenase (NAD+)